MKKLIITCLLLTVLQLANTGYSIPFRATGAKVLPTGSILAWGVIRADNTMLPAVVIVDSTGSIYDAFYLTVPNSRIVILDALDIDGRIVIGGFIERERLREAFAAKLNNKTLEWAFSLHPGPYFVKTLSRYNDEYILTGPVSGVSDSDIAVVYITERASIVNALRIGSPMYDDFVEKVYAFEDSLLLIGSTWCQNVSYTDALLIDLTNRSPSFVTIGGADRDEGFAAKVLDSGVVLVGSSFSSPGGLSDAYLAILKKTNLKVLTTGWPSYDGFIDACGNLTDLFLLGYSTIEGRNWGLVVRMSEEGSILGSLIESEESVVPLAIGYNNTKLVTVFKVTEALVVITFDYDLKPLTAFMVGDSNITTIRVRRLVDVEKRVYNMDGTWRIQELSLSSTPIEIAASSLNIEVHPLGLVSRPLRIEIGEYTERVPLTRLLVSAIEQNIPLLIIALPLFAVILAIIAARRVR